MLRRERIFMVDKLLPHMEQAQLDAFFVAKPENVRYISGYTGADSFLLITQDHNYFLTDPRYTEQAAQECPGYTICDWRSSGGLGRAVAKLLEGHGALRLGFEADVLNVAQYTSFQEEIHGQLVPTTDVIEKLRAIKTPQEISYLRAACEISCRALDRLLPEIRVGVTEKELAAKLSLYMVMEGADTMPYGNILISGARTSLLHGIPSEKAIEYGDFVLMDFGCQFHGYMSDMTRTVVVGKADSRQREVYELEKTMLEDSLARMKAGVPLREVYEASIRAIRDTEYFPYHYTGIGHGIGLFVHELPFMGPTSEEVLPAGNVRTIEPGLYIPGWGGVRIEDQILITETGYENMIRTTHDLIEL